MPLPGGARRGELFRRTNYICFPRSIDPDPMTTANTLRTALAAASLTVLCAACASNSAGPGPAHGTDPFDHNTLPSYAAYSDGGVTNWAIGGGELLGNGVSD